MIYMKIEQLIKMADIMVEGSINDFPKNLTNFKLTLEGVKMALENEKPKKRVNPFPIAGEQEFPFDDQSTLESVKTKPIVKDEVPVIVKRKRRTKVEMAEAALIEVNKLEDKIDSAIIRVEESGEHLKLSTETVEAIKFGVASSIKAKEVNKIEGKEDWESVLNDSDTELAPWKDTVDNIEETITELINKYPTPFNLAHLQTRKEKQSLVDDMLKIKELVGNENTADIKPNLSKLDLADDIMIRTYKFLMNLPSLQVELN